MLIGGDDISNDVITLGACFLVFFNVCLHLPSFPLCADWRNLAAQSTGSHRGIGERVERVRSYKLSFLFPPRPAARAPRRACSQARGYSLRNWEGQQYCHLTRS